MAGASSLLPTTSAMRVLALIFSLRLAVTGCASSALFCPRKRCAIAATAAHRTTGGQQIGIGAGRETAGQQRRHGRAAGVANQQYFFTAIEGTQPERCAFIAAAAGRIIFGSLAQGHKRQSSEFDIRLRRRRRNLSGTIFLIAI